MDVLKLRDLFPEFRELPQVAAVAGIAFAERSQFALDGLRLVPGLGGQRAEMP